MTRQQIMADLTQCLAAMGPESGQPLAAAEVRRGIHLAAELRRLPGLCVFNQKLETTEEAAGLAGRRLVVHVWGAAKAPAGQFAALDELLASVAAALADPGLNPHAAATSLGPVEVYEGGAGDPLGIFDLELYVDYEAGLGQV